MDWECYHQSLLDLENKHQARIQLMEEMLQKTLPNYFRKKVDALDTGRTNPTKRTERANIHHLKPVFVVDPNLQYHLVRYPGKEEISPAISQHSIY